jgi:hypothetical protein
MLTCHILIEVLTFAVSSPGTYPLNLKPTPACVQNGKLPAGDKLYNANAIKRMKKRLHKGPADRAVFQDVPNNFPANPPDAEEDAIFW